MLSPEDIQAIALTLQLAAFTTGLLLVISMPLAWWLANTQCRLKVLVEAFVALPLVLPPTVLGFYLLIAFGPDGPVGRLLAELNLPSISFSFTGLLVGSCIYSLPFVVQPLYNAFQLLDKRYIFIAQSLGASNFRVAKQIVLPLIKPGIITACVLGFAHTVGEFGVVLMIGGNIPGRTQLVSIAIFEHVEAFEYAQAHPLSLLLIAGSFMALLFVYAQQKTTMARIVPVKRRGKRL